eukprot:6613696-Prorocentrum_lima.AAC.1
MSPHVAEQDPLAGATMQIVILKGEAEPQPTLPPSLDNYNYEWEWRGAWLIRYHIRPRKKTRHPKLE